MFWVPGGFAHGFVGLHEINYVLYGCDGEYNGECECAINLFDPDIGIDLSCIANQVDINDLNISVKDKAAIKLGEWLKKPEAEKFVFGRNC